MKTIFIHNGHEIVLVRELTEMFMLIDGERINTVRGLFKKDQSTSMEGYALNQDGTKDLVKLEFICNGLKELFCQVVLYYNDEKIDVKQTL